MKIFKPFKCPFCHEWLQSLEEYDSDYKELSGTNVAYYVLEDVTKQLGDFLIILTWCWAFKQEIEHRLDTNAINKIWCGLSMTSRLSGKIQAEAARKRTKTQGA